MSAKQDAALRPKRKPNRSISYSFPPHGFPLASFLHPARSSAFQWLVIPTIALTALLLRWVISLGPYSGMASPPMHGDFEAQRHWMEITTQLPISEWYWHDLEWWGLDYPPLTAYHSWLVGTLGHLLDPSWFSLYTSRGLDDPGLKVFMRASVIISEFLLYIPAVIVFIRVFGARCSMTGYDKAVALGAILFQPALIIIDHGHFQYNSVMFGFTVLAVDCFISDHLLWGSFFFVQALCFKQMALYYSPIVFAYLLGLCWFPRLDMIRLIQIGSVVMATFTLLFAPLALSGGVPQVLQCIHRVFPFARGLWEDKVANFWCAANVIIKFREVFPQATLQKASLLATLASILPPSVLIFRNPTKQGLPMALSAGAWGFFLFSFQVHEKSVLLPLVPATLTLAGNLDPDHVSWITWMNSISMFSMWPLLRRDNLTLQYAVLVILHSWVMGTFQRLPSHRFGKLIHCSTYCAVILLHLAEIVIGPVNRFPDLWVVGNVLVCFGAYVVAWAWTLQKLWMQTKRSLPKTKAE